MKRRNAIANKQPSATPDESRSTKRLSDQQLKLVAGGKPKAGNINIGDGLLAPPNEPPVLG